MKGLALARAFYFDAVLPKLRDLPHAAALLGDGSEVLGFDDEVSTDHDFGARVQIFVANPAAVPALHSVAASTPDGFFRERLGVDPADGMRLADWLLAPTQVLATLTAGEVFHDPDGVLARRRAALAWYPDDVWRYALAAGWLRIGQEQAFVGRTGGRGDELGSRLVAARLARELVRLAFLVQRRWAPYSKWLGRAFADLPLAAQLRPHLDRALSTVDWREREAALNHAASALAVATNALELAEPVDPAPRQFFTRDIRVLDGERFTVALAATITDPELQQLLWRLGTRRGVPQLPGTIDQAVDSTDVLTHPARCRAAAGLLGLA